MFSLGVIKDMNRKAAERAIGKKPYTVKDKTKLTTPLPFPDFGDYRPVGFELVDTLFCDSSGFGDSNEPALTVSQLLDRIKNGYGYAIIETGQFQVYVGEFKPLKER